MAKKKAAPAQAGATIHIAVLDAAGFYRGVREVPAGTDGIVVDADCDLKPGAYRWNAAYGRFDPVRRQKVSGDKAIVDFIKAVRDQAGIKMPQTTIDWLADYDKRKETSGA